MNRPVYVVDGLRTPFLKATGKPNPLKASDLAVAAGQPLILRQPFEPEKIEEVIMGCVAPGADEANIGRLIALRLRLGQSVEGWTVQRNCGSGLQAIDCGAMDIVTGKHQIVLVGGTETMSRAPLMLNDDMVSFLATLQYTKSFTEKLKTLAKFRPRYLIPTISLLKGLSDPIVNLSMGQTAEILANQFGITREEMDAYAVQSHKRSLVAYEKGYTTEIVPLYDLKGGLIEFDEGVRRDSSVQKLAKLKPAFDKPFGNVTAGNSSQITDGAALLILASGDAVKEYKLPVLGKIISTTWSALDPAKMGLGPVYAISKLLKSNKLNLEDIDYWEINEAFAAQVLACLKAMTDEEFCQSQLGLKHALGTIPMEKLNVDGGAIAVGHPVGTSGARLVLQLLNIMKRNQAKRGVASLCIGGGQGGAILLENVE